LFEAFLLSKNGENKDEGKDEEKRGEKGRMKKTLDCNSAFINIFTEVEC